MRHAFLLGSALVVVLILVLAGFVSPHALWLFLLVGPVVLIGLHDMVRSTNNVERNYPFFGRLKELASRERHIPQQSVIQNSREGKPFNVVERRIVRGRTGEKQATQPYGSELELRDVGSEWLAHSAYPVDEIEGDLRFTLGGPRCSRPYEASLLNVSAMSFGSLGPNAVRALSEAAKEGGFALNTGEGGVSPHHLAGGGDLIYQIGTGYFGCRDDDGSFSPDAFRETVAHDRIRAVEIKISQGAKPGLGGILPAEKNIPEIAEVRGIEPGEAVHSPPAHSAFGNARELLELAEELRDLSDGRPVGVKVCFGRRDEIEDLCRAMTETGRRIDFLTLDSADGGTGAGVSDFVNWVGWTVDLALPIVHKVLREHGLRDDVRLIASGKVVTSFDLVRLLALGADGCNSARAMMQALGCVQSLKCDTNRCPTGIATLDPSLNKGLVVETKSRAVARYHRHTLDGVKKLVAAAGLRDLAELTPGHLHRRVGPAEVRTLGEVYGLEADV